VIPEVDIEEIRDGITEEILERGAAPSWLLLHSSGLDGLLRATPFIAEGSRSYRSYQRP